MIGVIQAAALLCLAGAVFFMARTVHLQGERIDLLADVITKLLTTFTEILNEQRKNGN